MPKAFRDFWPGSAYSLAKKAAVPEQTVRDLMKGRTEFSRMSVANAIKLAEAIGYTDRSSIAKIEKKGKAISLYLYYI